jgi:hypothetical protein
MSDKRLVYNLSEKEHDILRSVFFKDSGSTSDNYSSNIAVRELLNLIIITLPELKIFTEDEVNNLMEIVRNWQMDFTQFLIKPLALHWLHGHNDLYDKINNLSEFQIYVLLRWMKKIVNEPDQSNIASQYFCKYPE